MYCKIRETILNEQWHILFFLQWNDTFSVVKKLWQNTFEYDNISIYSLYLHKILSFSLRILSLLPNHFALIASQVFKFKVTSFNSYFENSIDVIEFIVHGLIVAFLIRSMSIGAISKKTMVFKPLLLVSARKIRLYVLWKLAKKGVLANFYLIYFSHYLSQIKYTSLIVLCKCLVCHMIWEQ